MKKALITGITGQPHRPDDDRPHQRPAYLDEVLKDAPGAPRIIMQKAKAFERLGRFEASLDLLRQLNGMGRPASIIRSKAEGLFKAYSRAHDEEAARKWCAEQRIDANFDIN